MDPKPLWMWFCMTGEPLAYLMYRSAEEQEDGDTAD